MKLRFLAALSLAFGALLGSTSLGQYASPVIVSADGTTLTVPGFVQADAAPGKESSSADRVNRESATDKIHQEMQQLEGKAAAALRDYARTTDETKRQALMNDLTKIVDQQFTVRQKLRTAEIEELEAQLKKLKDVHEQRMQQKARIVRDRVEQLLNDARGLGWGSSSLDGRVNVNFNSWSTLHDNLMLRDAPARTMLDTFRGRRLDSAPEATPEPTARP